MTQAWLTLTGVDGRDIAAPTEKQLAATLADVYARAYAAWEQDSWGKELVSQAE